MSQQLGNVPYVFENFKRQMFEAILNITHPGIQATGKLMSSKYVWPCINNVNASNLYDILNQKLAHSRCRIQPPYTPELGSTKNQSDVIATMQNMLRCLISGYEITIDEYKVLKTDISGNRQGGSNVLYCKEAILTSPTSHFDTKLQTFI